MTPTQRSALEQALAALERCVATCFDRRAHEQVMSTPEHFVNQSIAAANAALAEPEPEGSVCARCGGLVFDPVIQQPSKHDEVELLQADLDRHQQTIIEMGAMLRAIVNLIRGEPPEGESHSTHDAVELVRQLAMHNDLYVSAATRESDALKSEVEALRDSCEAKADRIDRLGETVERLKAENDALRAALAEPQDEPVAKVELMTTGGNAGLATRIVEIDDHLRERLRPGQMLYTHPAPQRQPQADAQPSRISDTGKLK